MPTYSTSCTSCKQEASIRLSFVDYESVKMGVKTLGCTSCSGEVQIEFKPGAVSFILKDGESGGFVSKAMKENKFRAKHREILGKKQKDHVFKSKLVPNYKGMETDTWKDAREEARKEGGNLSAATYEPLVKKVG